MYWVLPKEYNVYSFSFLGHVTYFVEFIKEIQMPKDHWYHLTRIFVTNVQVDYPAPSSTDLGPEKQEITLKNIHIKSNSMKK